VVNLSERKKYLVAKWIIWIITFCFQGDFYKIQRRRFYLMEKKCCYFLYKNLSSRHLFFQWGNFPRKVSRAEVSKSKEIWNEICDVIDHLQIALAKKWITLENCWTSGKAEGCCLRHWGLNPILHGYLSNLS
jgi:hypothetical protein